MDITSATSRGYELYFKYTNLDCQTYIWEGFDASVCSSRIFTLKNPIEGIQRVLWKILHILQIFFDIK